MPKHHYSDEYKREAAKLVDEGRPKAQVARELGVANTTIGHWVEQFGSKASSDPADESDELKQLREENRQLRMEREILPLNVSIPDHKNCVLVGYGRIGAPLGVNAGPAGSPQSAKRRSAASKSQSSRPEPFA